MTYIYPVQEYFSQLKAYNELEAMSFSPEETRDDFIAQSGSTKKTSRKTTNSPFA